MQSFGTTVAGFARVSPGSSPAHSHDLHKKLHSDPLRWSVFDVQVWLAQEGFGAYLQLFKNNDVCGKTLVRATEDTFVNDIGIRSQTDAARLVELVRQLSPACRSLQDWSESDVSAWLCTVGLPQLVQPFRLYGITGSLLSQLTSADVRDDLGIASLGLREKLMDEVADLKREQAHTNKERHASAGDSGGSVSGAGSVGGGRATSTSTTPARNNNSAVKRPPSASQTPRRGATPSSTRRPSSAAASSVTPGSARRSAPSFTSTTPSRNDHVAAEIRLTKDIQAAENKVTAARGRLVKAQESMASAESELAQLKKQLAIVTAQGKEARRNTVERTLFSTVKTPAKAGPAAAASHECTFQPAITARSRELASSSSVASESRPLHKRLADKTPRRLAGSAGGGGTSHKTAASKAEELEKNKRAATRFFREEYGWDLGESGRGADVELADVMSRPDDFGLCLSQPQMDRLEQLSGGWELAVALHSHMKLASFVNRMQGHARAKQARGDGDGSVTGRGHAADEHELAKARDFFKSELNWDDASEQRVDDWLRDSAAAELDDKAIRAIRSMNGPRKILGLYNALMTQDFLRRASRDLEYREAHMKQLQLAKEERLQLEKENVFKIPADEDPSRPQQSFMERYRADLETRRENLEKLTQQVFEESELYRECSFVPKTTVSGGYGVPFNDGSGSWAEDSYDDQQSDRPSSYY